MAAVFLKTTLRRRVEAFTSQAKYFMCGFAGSFQFHGKCPPELPHIVQLARDLLTHRGPDDAGLYISANEACVLGSRRLSIVDLSRAANQPMSNEDSTLWLVLNGEIYNHKKLRKALVESGHRFRSVCDAEVVLHLYEEHGTELLAQVDGIFSFVIYDERRHRLFGARDRLGVKPLYYSISSQRFAFASEPKALLKLPDVSRQPRVEEVPSYLTFDCVPGPHTLFRDVDKLEPGTLFEVDTDGTFHKRRFWHPGGGIADREDRDNIFNNLASSLSDAVTKRIATEVPTGATLSGGIDSSLIVALMTEALGTPLKTFTIGYPGDESNPNSDLSFARLVAQRFSTEHHEVVITHDDFLTVLEEDLPELADDPIGSPSQTAILHLAKRAKQVGVKVVQVGEGSDEIFCGYESTFQLWHFHKRVARFRYLLPRRFAKFIVHALGPRFENVAINQSRVNSMDGTLFEHLRRYANHEQLYWGFGILFCERDQNLLYGKTMPTLVNPYQCLKPRLNEVPDFNRRPYLDQLAITDLVLELPERLLMRLDKAMMLHGIEAREPFLDLNVLKTVFRFPQDIRASREKALLKSYARDKLPPEILMRPKKGFPSDSRIFLSPPVISRIRDNILSKGFLALTGFDASRLREFIWACETGRSDFFPHIWSIYILSLWFHRWIEGRG